MPPSSSGRQSYTIPCWSGCAYGAAGKTGACCARTLISSGDAGLLWGDVPDIAHPTPGVVRAIIEYALDQGWEPASVGGRHDIESGAELEIPGFHFTDQL